MRLGFQTSLLGTVIRSTLPSALDYFYVGERDPSFNPRDEKRFWNNDWLLSHPWMIEPYQNGAVDSIPNEASFYNFMSRAEEDWNIRSRLGQAGFGRQLVGGIIGGIPDFILGGMVARGVGVAGYLERAREWATTGGYLERAIKASTIGAAGNLSYDAAIRAASPSSRGPWTADEAANTAMVGAGFGLGLASLSMLAGTARGRNLAGRIGDAVAN
ncbi:MAG: hypothetical protein JNK96_04295, partial [Betaproteobacteria bacterium]|nr:hypothetical protein [Betaproteobacteria bacterium]